MFTVIIGMLVLIVATSATSSFFFSTANVTTPDNVAPEASAAKVLWLPLGDVSTLVLRSLRRV